MSKKSGFSLIEIIIAIGLFAIFIPAVVQAYPFIIQTTKQGEQFSQAYAYAQEGMEAIMVMKALSGTTWPWDDTSFNTITGEVYQPHLVAGFWTMGSKTTTPVINHAPYTQTVTLTPVYRCGLSICAFGVLDPYSRFVTVQVAWLEQGQPQEVKVEAYVTQH